MQSGLQERIIWLDYCTPDQISSYFAISHLGVMPFEDGISDKRSSFWSMMAHGLPVITTFAPRIPTGLRHNHNVVLVEPGNVDQLFNAMVTLLSDAEKRSAIGIGAAALMNSTYSWEAISGRLLALYGGDRGVEVRTGVRR
jgi:glycosyltransferase involved in cell wall biosynthesis